MSRFISRSGNLSKFVCVAATAAVLLPSGKELVLERFAYVLFFHFGR